MLKREIVDELYSQAIKRFRAECPELRDADITDQFADNIWDAIRHKLDKEGEEITREYVKNTKVDWYELYMKWGD